MSMLSENSNAEALNPIESYVIIAYMYLGDCWNDRI